MSPPDMPDYVKDVEAAVIQVSGPTAPWVSTDGLHSLRQLL